MKPILPLFVAIMLLLQYNSTAQCTGFDVQINKSTDTACHGQPIYMSGVATNSNATINWVVPPNNTAINNSVTIGAQNISQAARGYYYVTAILGQCVARDTIFLEIGMAPSQPTLSFNTPICEGDTLVATITPQTNYPWLTYGLHDGITGQQISPTQVTKIANASLSTNVPDPLLGVVADSVGCYTYDVYYFVGGEINETPAKPNATSNSPVCGSGNLDLFGGGQPWMYNYEWIGPSGTYNTQNISIPFAQHPKGKFEYRLRYNNNGCYSEYDTVSVEVSNPTTPKVQMVANPGFNVGPYTPITFTANVLDTGATVNYQWYKNLVAVPGGTNKTLTLSTSTDLQTGDVMTVRINTEPACATIKQVDSPPQTININLSVNNLSDNDINLYPNPVHDMLVITGLEKGAEVSVSTITGKQVAVDVTRDGTKIIINTSGLAEGNYILRSGNSAVRFIKAK